MTNPAKPKTDHTNDELEALAEWYDGPGELSQREPGTEVSIEVAADPTVVRSVRLRVSTVHRLKAEADARGVGPTELMREWIEERLDVESGPAARSAKLAILQTLASTLPSTVLGLRGVSMKVTVEDLPKATDLEPRTAKLRPKKAARTATRRPAAAKRVRKTQQTPLAAAAKSGTAGASSRAKEGGATKKVAAPARQPRAK